MFNFFHPGTDDWLCFLSGNGTGSSPIPPPIDVRVTNDNETRVTNDNDTRVINESS